MTRILLLPLLTIAVAATAFAQRPASDRLSERLGVSESTAAAVASALEASEWAPGALWSVAADLHAQLTSEQRAELVAAASRERVRTGGREARMRPHAHRGDRSVRPGAERRAQPEGGRRGALQGQRGARVPGMADLTEQQRTAVRGIAEGYAPRFREIAEARRSGTITAQQARDQRTALQTEMRQQIEPILTPEQRDRMASFQPRATAELGQAARAAALNLSAEQQAQLQAVREQQRQRAAQLRALAPADRRALRQHMPQLRSELQAAQAQVLTQEQQEIVAIHAALQKARVSGQTQRRIQRQR
jgi:hypothetical protein